MIYLNEKMKFFMKLLLLIMFSTQLYADDFPILNEPYLGQEPPGDTPVVFAPGIVSTGKEHSAAMFTPDGNEVWFGRLFPAAVYYMKRTNGTWTEPQVASFCDSSTTFLYPVLSPAGNQIFYSSDRPIDQQGERLNRGDYHIWMVEREAGKWSEPEHVDNRVNFDRRHSCGSIAANGDMYFASFVDNKSMDLFCSKLVDGAYDDPRNLTELNSPTPDHSPFVAPDGSYLIFSSFRGGLGRSDLFVSFRSSDGTWTKPRSMGPKINTAYKDEYPYVTPDGKYLFFNSNRQSSLNPKPIEDGPGNIYWVNAKIIERLRPENGGSR
jgi:Tol biopolymer transport system component